jgi:hypothetical protein
MIDIIEIMEYPRLAFIISCVIGFGLAAMMRPLCKGPDCIVIRGPEVSQFQNNVYQIGEGCYEFKVKPVQCPKDRTGLIKTFSFVDMD